MSFNFLEERVDDVFLGIQLVQTSDVVKQLDKLVMNLPLIFRLLFLLFYLSPQNFQKFRLEQHLFNSNEDLDNHFNDLTYSKFESDAIRDWYFIIDTLVSVQGQ